MATDIPKKNGSSKSKPVELAYPGKKSASIILNHLGHSGFSCMRHCSSGNRLYCGGNLNGLRELLADSSIRGKITLVYIDPPFATKGTFLSPKQRKTYKDDLCGAEYVENLRERLILIRELLSSSGSIYLHLDETMIFEMKLVMDEVFGSSNCRLPESTGSTLRKHLMKWTQGARYSGQRIKTPDARYILMVTPAFAYQIFGSTSKTLTIETSKSQDIRPRKIQIFSDELCRRLRTPVPWCLIAMPVLERRWLLPMKYNGTG